MPFVAVLSGALSRALRATALVALGVLLASTSGVLAGCSTTTANPQNAVTASTSASGASSSGLAPEQAASSLPTMTVAQLPAEGIKTLELIAQGGPFPYRKDGSPFGNRERRLPLREYGFYAEYTVPTPGESDRGPRRLVVGDDGSVFYTSDHYGSFREVIAG